MPRAAAAVSLRAAQRLPGRRPRGLGGFFHSSPPDDGQGSSGGEASEPAPDVTNDCRPCPNPSPGVPPPPGLHPATPSVRIEPSAGRVPVAHFDQEAVLLLDFPQRVVNGYLETACRPQKFVPPFLLRAFSLPTTRPPVPPPSQGKRQPPPAPRPALPGFPASLAQQESHVFHCGRAETRGRMVKVGKSHAGPHRTPHAMTPQLFHCGPPSLPCPKKKRPFSLTPRLGPSCGIETDHRRSTTRFY